MYQQREAGEDWDRDEAEAAQHPAKSVKMAELGQAEVVDAVRPPARPEWLAIGRGSEFRDEAVMRVCLR
jgi:hypothetical protein